MATISHCLRKSPELLHRHFARISRELESLVRLQAQAKK